MKSLSVLAALLALTIVLGAGEPARDGPAFKGSLSEVITAAKTSGKPMVVVFSSPGCVPCQVMKRDVFPSPGVKALQDQFEWAYLDTTLPIHEEAVSMFRVYQLPHIQFLDAKGNALAHIGYADAPTFAATLKHVLTLVPATK